MSDTNKNDTNKDNPLLDYNGLPHFSRIRLEDIKPAVLFAIAKCNSTIEQVSCKHQQDATWDNAIAPIEEADDRLSKVWGLFLI